MALDLDSLEMASLILGSSLEGDGCKIRWIGHWGSWQCREGGIE